MSVVQQIMQMKKEVDAAASVVAKIAPSLDSINALLTEVKAEAQELGITIVCSFYWGIIEVDRIGGNAFPDPDEWISSSAQC